MNKPKQRLASKIQQKGKRQGELDIKVIKVITIGKISKKMEWRNKEKINMETKDGDDTNKNTKRNKYLIIEELKKYMKINERRR